MEECLNQNKSLISLEKYNILYKDKKSAYADFFFSKENYEFIKWLVYIRNR